MFGLSFAIRMWISFACEIVYVSCSIELWTILIQGLKQADCQFQAGIAVFSRHMFYLKLNIFKKAFIANRIFYLNHYQWYTVFFVIMLIQTI